MSEEITNPRLADRVTVNASEAAELLGVSSSFFTEFIAPMIRTIEVGDRTLISTDELRGWAIRHSELRVRGTRR